MRQNLTLTWMFPFLIGLISLSGCKSGGLQLPTMPNMAFWKKDGMQWTRKDPIPPPATHFDPEPASGGFTRESQVADSKPAQKLTTPERPDFSVDSLAKSTTSKSPPSFSNSSSDSATSNPAQGKPIRKPYQYSPSEALAVNSNSENAFQPAGTIKKQLPDFSNSTMSAGKPAAAAGNFASTGRSSAFVPPNGTQADTSKSFAPNNRMAAVDNNSFQAPGSTVQSKSASTPTNTDLEKVRTDFQAKIASQFPGMANHFGEQGIASGSSSSTSNTKFPSLTPKPPSTASNGSFAPKIQTPNRVPVPPTQPKPNQLAGKLDRILTPNIEKPAAPSMPNNQLRFDASSATRSNLAAAGSYPETRFNGLAPLRGETKPATGTTLSPMLNQNAKSNTPKNPGGTTGVDVLLPASLRSANLNFAPGSVTKLTPAPTSGSRSSSESGSFVR